MKKLLLTSVFCSVLVLSYAQLPEFKWAGNLGGIGGLEIGNAITVDAAGNVFVTGAYAGPVDFDPGAGTATLSSIGNGDDVFIAKYDNTGAYVWAKSVGGAQSDHAYSIGLDASGNIYIAGWFQATADFDPGAGTQNLTSTAGQTSSFNSYVLKLNAAGDFVWVKQFAGGNPGIYTHAMTVDATGNVFSTGFFSGTADFDPGAGTQNLTAQGTSPDIFISKLDASGSFVWVKHLSGNSVDKGRGITTDAAGNIYVTGEFLNTIDFDPGAGTQNLTSAGIFDIFVLKLNSAGNYVWARNMGGTMNDQPLSIAVDASMNVYTTGTFIGTSDFDPGAGTVEMTSAGTYDIFVSKLDASGNFAWAKRMGNTGEDHGQAITTDVLGNVYLTGKFQATVDFDPGAGTQNLVSAGGFDIFSMRLSSAGNLVWAFNMGGILDDEGFAITTDAARNIYTTGAFNGTADFDPGSGTNNITTAGQSDAFIQKLSRHPSSIDNHALNGQAAIYPNPGKGLFILHTAAQEGTLVRVYNSMGLLIHETDASKEETIIDLSLQPSGLYIVEVMHAGQTISQGKIIKY